MRHPRAAWLVVAAALACSRQPPPAAPPPIPSATRPAAYDTTVVHPPEKPPAAEPIPAGRRRLLASVRATFTGDINLGTTTLPDGVPPDSGRRLFEHSRPILAGDLVVGNFEGVLADSGTSQKCRPPTPMRHRRRAMRHHAEPPRVDCYAFLTPTYLAPRLAEAGFTQLNLANNHANDYGAAGRASTERTLSALGIGVYGPLGRIIIDTLQRGDSVTTIGLLGFTTYSHSYDLLDVARSVAVVDSIRPLVDVLIVTFHGGSEGIGALHVPAAAESLGTEPRGNLRRWTRAVIDAGADAVIGHGPHVLRGIEVYRGKLVAYSLGNFLTYRGFNLSGPLGVTAVLQLEIPPGRSAIRARLVPMRQLPGQGPAPDPDKAAIDLVRRLSGEDFGETAARIADDGTITAP